MNNTWMVLINLGGSALLAFVGSFVGSYLASYRATHRAEREEQQGQ